MQWGRRYKPKSEAEYREKWKQLPLEKGDIPAMLIAALVTLLPVVLLVGGAFVLVIWFFFLR